MIIAYRERRVKLKVALSISQPPVFRGHPADFHSDSISGDRLLFLRESVMGPQSIEYQPRNPGGSGRFKELEAFKNLLKRLDIFIKVVSMSSAVMNAIKPFVGDKSTIDALDLKSIFILVSINGPKS